MANLSTLETDPFLLQVERVRGEIRTKFARAHEVLQRREAALLSELQQLEATYKGEGVREQIDELNRLKEMQLSTIDRTLSEDTLKQSVAMLDARVAEIRDRFEKERAGMGIVVLEWEFEGRIGGVGFIRVSAVPDYKKKGEMVLGAGKHSIRKTSLPGVFYYPQSIFIDAQTHNVFICDGGNDRVQMYSESFQLLFEFSEKMDKPYGVCTGQQKVYVTQRSGHSLNVYSPDGKLLESVGKEGNNELEFSSPTGVAVSTEERRIYVCEGANKRVQCLNLNLTFNSYISDVNLPRDIKLTPYEIAVLESEGQLIRFYDYSHEPIRQLLLGGGKQTVDPRFFYLDLQNNILTTDYSNNAVFIFSPSGELMHKFCKKGDGKGPGEFSRPTGIVMDSGNRIIVVSQNYGHCIQLF